MCLLLEFEPTGMETGETTGKREIRQGPEHGQLTTEESLHGTRTSSKPTVNFYQKYERHCRFIPVLF